MDPNNPVVKLCSEGMQAESEGRNDDARNLFIRAWDIRQNDHDACIAAHFVARHQETPEQALHWNQEALNRADAVGGEAVQSFYPSLYLNMGKSYEDLGNHAEATRYYALAAERVGDLPAGRYGNLVQNGIAEGQNRVATARE